MSVFHEKISIKIKDVKIMSWDASSINVNARVNHSLSLRLSGSAAFTAGNTRVQSCANDVFYMPAYCAYHAHYPDKNKVITIVFESDLRAEPENFTLTNPQVFATYFQKIYDIWQQKAEGHYFAAVSVLCEIIEAISVQHTPSIRNQTTEAFDRAVAYIEENGMSADFSVEKATAVACMSNTYFRKLFLAKYGVTPVKYVISKKLSHAEKLLSTGKYSIKEVAELSGFSDAKYFSRVVKKEYGVPPSKLYRHIL